MLNVCSVGWICIFSTAHRLDVLLIKQQFSCFLNCFIEKNIDCKIYAVPTALFNNSNRTVFNKKGLNRSWIWIILSESIQFVISLNYISCKVHNRCRIDDLTVEAMQKLLDAYSSFWINLIDYLKIPIFKMEFQMYQNNYIWLPFSPVYFQPTFVSS